MAPLRRFGSPSDRARALPPGGLARFDRVVYDESVWLRVVPRPAPIPDLTGLNLMPRPNLRPLTLVAILALMAVVVGAQAPNPAPVDQLTAKVVVHLLERGHMA